MSKRSRLWLELGKPGSLVTSLRCQQDHAVGMLRTILHNAGVMTRLASTRNVLSKSRLCAHLDKTDILLMSVLSFNFHTAVRCARLFKKINPKGLVITGGMHASVALDEMIAVREFDYICQGAGEKIIAALASEPEQFERVIVGQGAKSMADWPYIDRTLWPEPLLKIPGIPNVWPLERLTIESPPSVTILTSRVCPWQCAFCNESSYIPAMSRRPVEMVIEELNRADRLFGPFNSVIIHDSNFFQNPAWLREWLEKYPQLANRRWPYWAAARADMIRKWPDLFVALVKETNWRTISLGLESGSDRVLRILNKECSEQDNNFAIDLINSIGQEMSAKGQTPPRIYANIILAIPGESEADARKTVAMINNIKNARTSVSFFSPYPGSILGYQMIAEGKSLITGADYHRYPGRETVRGVDYKFYSELLSNIDGYRGAKRPINFVGHVYNTLFSKTLGETG